jgi:hypothetical protein
MRSVASIAGEHTMLTDPELIDGQFLSVVYGKARRGILVAQVSPHTGGHRPLQNCNGILSVMSSDDKNDTSMSVVHPVPPSISSDVMFSPGCRLLRP